jgi:hypothetical protein
MNSSDITSVAPIYKKDPNGLEMICLQQANDVNMISTNSPKTCFTINPRRVPMGVARENIKTIMIIGFG